MTVASILPARSQSPMLPGRVRTAPLPLMRSAPQSPVVVDNPNQYALGSGDQVQINVVNYDEVTSASTVMPDGTITLPLIGSLNVAGMTTEQLARQLQVRWNRYLINPSVTVSLTARRPVTVSVSGEVQRPGPRKFNSSDGNANLMAAVAAAGGITRNADISAVTIKRRMPGNMVKNLTFNLWDTVNSDQIPEDLALQDGDAISIPKLVAGATVDRRLVARSSLAANTVRVRVVGEVKQPGEVQVPPDSSLSSAVAIAGGPTNDAKLDDVTFVRVNEQGTIEQKKMDLSSLNDQIQVQEGDVLMVPKKPAARALDTVGRVIGPFGFLLRLFTGF
ncbi:polysaccharide biosynthesis/export family protein [Leptolyngbya boryana CZ1]|uniref:Polysaccharide biosynthesis/export family protein n=1 Tax=Leptolyngbya boryana CZ1 TaxID=3060204 RepID=A0AA96WYR0_LEPBY|nr:polysaccharide biosynthesis/export family protein [Leptolyngbya boryana]WNZ47623.1 polysaccharide biosynthesis/export family protein [Leptolyngbya boryana CZ1]